MTHGIEMPEMFKNILSNSSYVGTALLGNTVGNSSPTSKIWARPTPDRSYESYITPKGEAPVADAKPAPTTVELRIVKIVIADVDKNLPVGKRIIHNGVEQVTDLTDDELFFEVPIVDLLKTHNELRAKTLNKTDTAKAGKDVFLEPIRVRDLRMVVVDIADFSN